MFLFFGIMVYEDLVDVDFVIEVVFEKMEVKKVVFFIFDSVCKLGVIFVLNIFIFDIDEIVMVILCFEDVIGLYFFFLVNVMKLLEVVKVEKIVFDVIKICMKMVKKIRKVVVFVGVCFGFVGNCMIEFYGCEVNRFLFEGVSLE